MRLKSEIWVKAYVRRCGGEGVPVAVMRRGDADAGMIYIRVSRLDGTAALFGPAVGGVDRGAGDRSWSEIIAAAPEAEIEARLQRELRIDTDIWVLEVEDRQGRHFLDGWLAGV